MASTATPAGSGTGTGSGAGAGAGAGAKASSRSAATAVTGNSCPIKAVAIVERDINADVRLAWSYPSVQPPELETVIVAQSSPMLEPDAATTSTYFTRCGGMWTYGYVGVLVLVLVLILRLLLTSMHPCVLLEALDEPCVGRCVSP